MDIWERMYEKAKEQYHPEDVSPCGACREFLYQLTEENEDMEIMLDYEKRETVTLKELIPNWWGHERFAEAKRG